MFVRAAIALSVIIPIAVVSPASAQQKHQSPGAIANLPYDTPIKSQLNEVFGRLGQQVKIADALMQHLREISIKKPQEVQQEIEAAAR